MSVSSAHTLPLSYTLTPTYSGRHNVQPVKLNRSNLVPATRIGNRHLNVAHRSRSGQYYRCQISLRQPLRHLHHVPGRDPHPAPVSHLRPHTDIFFMLSSRPQRGAPDLSLRGGRCHAARLDCTRLPTPQAVSARRKAARSCTILPHTGKRCLALNDNRIVHHSLFLFCFSSHSTYAFTPIYTHLWRPARQHLLTYPPFKGGKCE